MKQWYFAACFHKIRQYKYHTKCKCFKHLNVKQYHILHLELFVVPNLFTKKPGAKLGWSENSFGKFPDLNFVNSQYKTNSSKTICCVFSETIFRNGWLHPDEAKSLPRSRVWHIEFSVKKPRWCFKVNDAALSDDFQHCSPENINFHTGCTSLAFGVYFHIESSVKKPPIL